MTESRRYPPRPVLGVGAVIFAPDGRVVLVRRGNEPLVGTWTLPGGAVETGETLEEAVVREVLEETGLEVGPGAILEVVEHMERDDTGAVLFHFVIVDFLCAWRSGVLAAGSDAGAVTLVACDDLERPDVTQKTRDVIARGRTHVAAAAESNPRR